YIIDPEQFFGNAQYMTSTLMATSEGVTSSPPMEGRRSTPWGVDDDEDDRAIRRLLEEEYDDDEEESSWRLLIIEDAEEFLHKDAKEHVGQALSRLLNVGDGFI